jgi:hypothetical protein
MVAWICACVRATVQIRTSSMIPFSSEDEGGVGTLGRPPR